eukprot:CAMPEP_0201551128 /NCGR_PEP_ID=MMETSP0173_2-20130828/7366_1 /ASSEMBLY_ACC=CAM_ASM_000268 /TAXON_ID=218659 /ORGANISM="Vexillifera sp., Strain DIVA3 564/2" /LENGTH=111 /DNA_ID=CAMNT_0047961311 /DNA_START=134 /DNA_END=466 /DNA_ORIENTATION=-
MPPNQSVPFIMFPKHASSNASRKAYASMNELLRQEFDRCDQVVCGQNTFLLAQLKSIETKTIRKTISKSLSDDSDYQSLTRLSEILLDSQGRILSSRESDPPLSSSISSSS